MADTYNPDTTIYVEAEIEANIALAAAVSFMSGEALSAEVSETGLDSVRQQAIYGLTGEVSGLSLLDEDGDGIVDTSSLSSWVLHTVPRIKQVEAVAELVLAAIDYLEANESDTVILTDTK